MRPSTGEGVFDRSRSAADTARLLEARDSGKGGIGGGRSARRVGRCGLSAVASLLWLGDPGSLLNVYEENRFDARRSKASDRPSAARVARVSGGTSGRGSIGGDGSASSKPKVEDGRLSVGNEGGAAAAGTEADGVG